MIYNYENFFSILIYQVVDNEWSSEGYKFKTGWELPPHTVSLSFQLLNPHGSC